MSSLKDTHPLTADMEFEWRNKLNPVYVNVSGTESHERATLFGEIDRLRDERDELAKQRGELAARVIELQAAMADAPREADAQRMGEVGGTVCDGERLAFEAWMRGHCWALCATWDGKQYRSDAEHCGWVDARAMVTRQLWAAWRDRAALSKASRTVNVASDSSTGAKTE